MERIRGEQQHLGLPIACAVVYSNLTGVAPDPRKPAEMRAILDGVAHALSNIVVIYAPEAVSGAPRPIEPVELIEGRFTDGAHVFRSRRSVELRGLTIQRRDIASAIGILRAAHITFRKTCLEEC